jgi:hypothetical protein
LKDAKLWLTIRTAYIVKRWSAQRCADEFKIDITTIKKRASKEGWTRERHRNATAARSVAEGETRQAVAAEAQRRQALMDNLCSWAAERIKESGQQLEKITNPRANISARRDIIEMFERWVKSVKIVDDDRPTERDDELIIEHRRLEPVKIPVGEDGRAIRDLQRRDDNDAE